MIAIRRRVTRSLVTTAVLALAVGGCGLGAELDRERNPEQTQPEQKPPSTPPAVSAAPVPEPSASVPTQEAGGCPSSGVRLDTGPVNGAMGLRAMTLTLTNCGKRPYELNGYPSITVLDEAGDPFPEVRTVEGTDQVPVAPEAPGPEPMTLAPGETAQAGLVWRMHAEDGVYLRVTPQKGRDTVTVRSRETLDIGPDNILGTSPWKPLQ
ncbi:DUF4232 domain-containing protein [Streptomyces yerevanensis]|uniref:DUF4232 domain-containing protein n=1 Tax=Streptomyces yerevanensis TaxID=66378 RepID=UPI0009980BA9|nr:DUF4232 domain-containing protein [Streptomyces yerevanensis]